MHASLVAPKTVESESGIASCSVKSPASLKHARAPRERQRCIQRCFSACKSTSNEGVEVRQGYFADFSKLTHLDDVCLASEIVED
eukprot:894492-Pleurochrysis_carterae.AAC.1